MEAGERAENLERQAEEAEALAAIYGDDFVREGDGGTVSYCAGCARVQCCVPDCTELGVDRCADSDKLVGEEEQQRPRGDHMTCAAHTNLLEGLTAYNKAFNDVVCCPACTTARAPPRQVRLF